MDISLMNQASLMTSFWIILAHAYINFLLLVFYVMRSTNRTVYILAESAFYCFLNFVCTLVMATNLSIISGIKFHKILFSTWLNSSNVLTLQCTSYNLDTRNIYIFVFSYYLYSTINTGLLKFFKTIEFFRILFLTCLFIEAYYIRLLSLIFFIGSVSNIVQNFKHLTNTLCVVRKRNESKTIIATLWVFKILTHCIWLYVFMYLIPICLFQILLLETGDLSFKSSYNLFKILFILYYITEILNCPLTKYIAVIKIKIGIHPNLFKPIFGYLKFKLNFKKKSGMNEAEEALSMYTAQGKSVDEVKKQLALMQMIRCVVALRKKAKRLKKNKSKNTNTGNTSENK